jgi:hypothetical protein
MQPILEYTRPYNSAWQQIINEYRMFDKSDAHNFKIYISWNNWVIA